MFVNRGIFNLIYSIRQIRDHKPTGLHSSTVVRHAAQGSRQVATPSCVLFRIPAVAIPMTLLYTTTALSKTEQGVIFILYDIFVMHHCKKQCL